MARNFYISSIGEEVGLTIFDLLVSGEEGHYFLRLYSSVFAFCIMIFYVLL